MNKLKVLIDEMPLEDLKNLSADLSSGNMEKLINNKIKTINRGKQLCPVCHASVDESNDIMLTFGSHGFRKKAVFCANDCLEYFLHRWKNGTS